MTPSKCPMIVSCWYHAFILEMFTECLADAMQIGPHNEENIYIYFTAFLVSIPHALSQLPEEGYTWW